MSQEAEHSPEPWTETGLPESEGRLAIVSDGPKAVAYVPATNKSREQAEADARRIVAAVNACEGVPVEVLESGVIQGFPAIAKRCVARLENAGSDMDQIMKARWDVIDGLKHAIAKAEGSAAAPKMMEALRAIAENGPEERPEYEDWGGDTERAEKWGLRMGAWEAARIARGALADIKEASDA